MPTYPVLQPDKRLAVWSTVVDHFIALGCNVADAAHIISMRHSGDVRKVCEQVAAGEIPFDHFQKWEKLVGEVLGRYGEEDETVKLALERTPDRRYPDLYAAVWRAEGRMDEAEYEAEKLRAQVEQLTADAIIRADRQAILIQAMWHIRENSLYYHDRDIATKVLTDIGELR
jgi:hypothetical protein